MINLFLPLEYPLTVTMPLVQVVQSKLLMSNLGKKQKLMHCGNLQKNAQYNIEYY